MMSQQSVGSVGKASREPIARRAGTHLRRGKTITIWARAANGKRAHGSFDTAQLVYQHGGEAANFILQKRRWVTLSLVAWQAIQDKARTCELVDHAQNVCYRAAVVDLRRHGGTVYDAGIGQRIGWPVGLFQVVDADGVVIVDAVSIQPEPPAPPRLPGL